MPKNVSGGANIAFEIRGYNRVRNSMRAVIAAHPKDVNQVMRKWAENTRMFLKRTAYPAKPANSRYTRTGRLASSWKKQEVKPGVWAITNDARGPRSQFYARYVVGAKDGAGDQRQAWMHRNRWWNADVIIQTRHIPELTAFLGELYEDLWNK